MTAPARLRVRAAPGFEGAARRWARRLGAPYGDVPARFELRVGEDGLELRSASGPDVGGPPLTLDLSRRRAEGEPVVRAVRGRRSAAGLRVVDATAGLGVDAAALARAGMRVVAIERDPLLAALLEDALARWADRGGDAAPALVELVRGDAREVLPRLRPAPDVVYLDPMYPRGKGGAKRKGAAWLRAWTGERGGAADDDDRALLAVARATARMRVVVKRPIKAPPLAPGASGSLRGTTTRFDLYPPDAEAR